MMVPVIVQVMAQVIVTSCHTDHVRCRPRGFLHCSTLLGEISSDDACLELPPKVLNGCSICVVYVPVSRAPMLPLQALAAFAGRCTAIKAGCYYPGGELSKKGEQSGLSSSISTMISLDLVRYW